MDHAEATILLADAARDQLPPKKADALRRHLSECPECAESLKVCQLLSYALSTASDAADHLDAELLSRFACRETSLTSEEVSRCKAHLEVCRSCAIEFDLVQSSIVGSRFGISQRMHIARMARDNRISRRTLALAAALLLAIAGAVFLPSKPHSDGKGQKNLVSQTLSSGRVHSDHPIFVEATTIEGGSVVDLSSQMVTFGNGFSVGSGAVLSVGNRASTETAKPIGSDPFETERRNK